LLGLITAKRLTDAGHKAIMLIGDATAEVGDPTGKNEMRKMLSEMDIFKNGEAIKKQIRNLVPEGILLNNNIWFKHASNMSFLQVLREFGPHFSVNNMLRADSVKSRLENGLSFLEFNYMVMQAIDFLKLNQFMDCNCQLQIGGDDQWSNMLAGVDLVHKKLRKEVFALTFPLLVNSDGTKMGKTEKGAVWLDENKTSVFDFFQFWRNIPDDKVNECISFFTSINQTTLTDINWKKKFLAFEVTKLVHGKEKAEQALEQAEALFESRDTSTLEATPIEDGIQLLDLLVQGSFAKSRTDARNLINGKGIAINDQIVESPLLVVTRTQFGSEITIKKGKKSFGRFVIKDPNA
jgi:tyrosyl-tRNA synthetase